MCFYILITMKLWWDLRNVAISKLKAQNKLIKQFLKEQNLVSYLGRYYQSYQNRSKFKVGKLKVGKLKVRKSEGRKVIKLES